jgi:predicted 3-demethylubiquinone-9 3-methyltransferase (glyoxalase superfamily)
MDAFATCLWFDTEGEEAARFYARIFPNSSVGKITPYPAGDRAGQTMTVDFVLNGSKFVALNGGPEFTFNESISFMVPCEGQAEIDRYWSALRRVAARNRCVAGSRTGLVSRGRLCQADSRSCSPGSVQRKRSESPRRCSR